MITTSNRLQTKKERWSKWKAEYKQMIMINDDDDPRENVYIGKEDTKKE